MGKHSGEFVSFKEQETNRESVMIETITEILEDRDSSVPLDRIVICGQDNRIGQDNINGITITCLTNPVPDNDDLIEFLGQKILLVTLPEFAAEIFKAQQRSGILAIKEFNLSKNRAIKVCETRDFSTGDEIEPIFIETYADFPVLFDAYLERMESIKFNLTRISQAEQKQNESMREVGISNLEDDLATFAERHHIAKGLPDMSLEDIKMNLASLLSQAHREANINIDITYIQKQLERLKGLMANEHEFSLAIETLPPELQKKIDSNNLLLALLETEKRYRLVEQLKQAIGDQVEAMNLLGSAAYGAYYEVKESSDVDTEIFFSDDDLHEFITQFEVATLGQLGDQEVNDILQSGRGKIFATIKALVTKEYIKNGRDALRQFGVFAKLRSMDIDQDTIEDRTNYQQQEKVGKKMADYLSYKVTINGVDISIHVVSTEAYQQASTVDLENMEQTQVLHEVRVGARKKIIAGQKESSEQNFTHYPDKKTFAGERLDYSCPVTAVVAEGDSYLLYEPSELAPKSIAETEVLAWITEVPVAIVEGNKFFHGLFQDKSIWGEFETTGVAGAATELTDYKVKLLVNLVQRFIKEQEEKIITSKQASILQLASRYERIPAYTKRKLLLWLKEKAPEAFTAYAMALKNLNSKELERFGLV